MRLVVAADHAPAGGEDEDAVRRAIDMHAVLRRDGDSAGQQAVLGPEQGCRPGALEFGEGAVLVGPGVLERVGDRRFGPEQQPRLGRRRSGQ